MFLTYFYGAEALRPPLLRTDPTTKLRRRPGAKAEPAAAPAPAPAAAQETGGQAPNAAFAKRLERVFADDGASTCGYCHRTTAVPGDKGVEYDIVPVQVQRLWEPLARFDHAAHANLSCASCHDAAASIDSSTVLLPPIASCRECHQGEAARCGRSVDLHHVPRLPSGEGYLPDRSRHGTCHRKPGRLLISNNDHHTEDKQLMRLG